MPTAMRAPSRGTGVVKLPARRMKISTLETALRMSCRATGAYSLNVPAQGVEFRSLDTHALVVVRTDERRR
jgi:hypothetical protein